MHDSFLLGAGLVLAALALAGVLFLRLRQSIIPAFILLGVVARPEHLEPRLVQTIATVGVVLLLFSMGLEFSLGALLRNRHQITRAGGIDLLACLPIGVVAGLALGEGWAGALLFAGAFYVSSSAIIAKSIIELRRAADPETEAALGILVFEDVGIALYLAVLSGAVLVAEPSIPGAAWGVGRALLFFGVVVLLALRGRALLDRIFDLENDDLFLLLVGGLVLLLSWAALRAGLSEALGGFLAGLALAETRHKERAERLFAPLQGVFAAIFFFAFGLSIDPGSFGVVWLPALALTTLAVVVKVGGGWFAGRANGLDPRGALTLGLTLVARGEFSIILAGIAVSVGLDRLGALIALLVLALSLVGTLSLRYAPAITDRVFPRRPAPSLEERGFSPGLAAFEPERGQGGE
ncbi:MAG TPA: cation:proton antiporter [Longimicrobiaceae bacterium]|nr:cation:proton antiporter [Longimicrobiaceae bacterium]